MSDIPNRPELERDLAEAIAKALGVQFDEVMQLLGDPPKLENIPAEWWESTGRELSNSMQQQMQDIYIAQAELLMKELPVGVVDWGLINTRAIEWVNKYTFELVRGITDVTRRGIQTALTAYYENGTMTISQLADSLTNLFGPVRAEMIAVTEVTRASVQGELALVNMIEMENPHIKLIATWQTANDDRVCEICAPRDGTRYNEGWYDYPPAHPRCLPGDSLVASGGSISAGSKRWYKGDVITIETLENKLTITPNHPILTDMGWVRACDLKEGSNIFGYSKRDWESFLIDINNKDGIPTIENIFSSLGVGGFTVPVSSPDFHNDGGNSDVAIIRTNSEIMDYIKSNVGKPFPENYFAIRNIIREVTLSHLGSHAQLGEWDVSISGSIMGGFDLAQALLGRHPLPLNCFGLRLISWSDSTFDEISSESASTNTSLFSKSIFGLTGNISLNKIIKIGYDNFSGHVYNLQTSSGMYVANGIITHNCRCWVNHEMRVV